MKKAIRTAVGCLLATGVAAAPIDDLASSSQPVRDVAAKLLRATFTPTPRSTWEPVVAELRPGESKDSVLQRLRPFIVRDEGGVGSGQSFSESYRFDDAWLLRCSYRRSTEGGTLFRHELIEHLRHVWIAPPADFTGVWITYFVNGQRSHEIHYADGRYSGVFTAFHSNGSKAYVQHYAAEGAEGDDTGYFPTGAFMYQGQYRKGVQTGTWIHYNEDGSVRAITQHPNPADADRNRQPEGA